MIKHMIYFVSLYCSVSFVSAFAEAPVDVVQKRYDSLSKARQTVKADFKQVLSNPKFEEPIESSGVVIFSFPGKMRWEYAVPSEKVFVNDGNEAWLIDKSYEQAIPSRIDQNNLSLAFLSGKGRLKDSFNVVNSEENKRNLKLTLETKTSELGVSQIQLTFSKAKGFISGIEVIDQFGNKNVMTFSNFTENTKVKDSLFEYKEKENITSLKKQ